MLHKMRIEGGSEPGGHCAAKHTITGDQTSEALRACDELRDGSAAHRAFEPIARKVEGGEGAVRPHRAGKGVKTRRPDAIVPKAERCQRLVRHQAVGQRTTTCVAEPVPPKPQLLNPLLGRRK